MMQDSVFSKACCEISQNLLAFPEPNKQKVKAGNQKNLCKILPRENSKKLRDTF